jgi:1-deoxy-D-xylulose-5-phosphate reductoisomerase
MSSPDMRTPIAHALGYPARLNAPAQRLDLASLGKLTFEKPDYDRFPCLRVAQDVLRRGGAAPTLLTAANEVAVAAFLARRIGFTAIAEIVEETLAVLLPETGERHPGSLAEVLEMDSAARRAAEIVVRNRAGS